MINTKELRKQFASQRATMTQNERHGTLVFVFLGVVTAAVILWGFVRLVCIIIVALNN